MKFIADSMLGRLARWLRLLGHDTLYFPHIEDSLLLRIAKEEGRTLLTRNTRLARVRGLNNYLLLTANDTFEQLRQVITAYGLTPPLNAHDTGVMSRCSLCNAPLDSVPKAQAKNHVPEYVYLTAGGFKKCRQCGKFYWRGTHQEKLEKKLREIF